MHRWTADNSPDKADRAFEEQLQEMKDANENLMLAMNGSGSAATRPVGTTPKCASAAGRVERVQQPESAPSAAPCSFPASASSQELPHSAVDCPNLFLNPANFVPCPKPPASRPQRPPVWKPTVTKAATKAMPPMPAMPKHGPTSGDVSVQLQPAPMERVSKSVTRDAS